MAMTGGIPQTSTNMTTDASSTPRAFTGLGRLPARLWCGPLLALLAVTAVSCSSVKIQSQRNPAVTGPVAARRLMVVGLEERPAVRAQFENQFVAQWKVASVECSSSHQQFALSSFSGDREEIRRKLAAAGLETVLAVRATDRVSGVEGAGVNVGLYGGGLSWSDVDESRYRRFTSGGEITTYVILSGKLFRVSDGALLWSSSTEIKLGESYDQDGVLREAAGAIAGQLRHDKVFE